LIVGAGRVIRDQMTVVTTTPTLTGPIYSPFVITTVQFRPSTVNSSRVRATEMCTGGRFAGCVCAYSLGRLSDDPAAPSVRRALEGVIGALLMELGQERVALPGAGVGVRAPDFAARPLNGGARVVSAALSW
jgi:hypothetical protein